MQCPHDELQLELAYYRENLKGEMGNEQWFVEERNKRSEVMVGKQWFVEERNKRSEVMVGKQKCGFHP
jgi:aminoglycoside phosphotransferase